MLVGAQDRRIKPRTDCSGHRQPTSEKIRTERRAPNGEKHCQPYLLDRLMSEPIA